MKNYTRKEKEKEFFNRNNKQRTKNEERDFAKSRRVVSIETRLMHRLDPPDNLTHLSRDCALAGFVVFAREIKGDFFCFV